MFPLKGLILWSLDHGASKSSKIEFCSLNNYGHGGIVKERICEGESLISIPLSISIDPEVAKSKCSFKLRSEFPFSVDEQKNNFNLDVVYMYIFMIEEKRKCEMSFYHPYINTLPVKFPNFPVFHLRCSALSESIAKEQKKSKIDAEEVEGEIDGVRSESVISFREVEVSKFLDQLLRGTNLLRSLRHLYAKLVRLYLFVISHDSEFLQSIKFEEELLWAFNIVWSRAFPIYEKGTKNAVPTLLPFIDVLNHQHGCKREFLVDYDSRSFTLKTMEDISVKRDGSKCQIFNNYGAKSNDSFLQSYGFVVEDNRDDTFYLQLGGSGSNDIREEERGVYLKKVCVDVKPLHDLIRKIQQMIDLKEKRGNPSPQVSEEIEFSIEKVSLRSLSTLRELLSNKKSELSTSEKNDQVYEKGSFEWMCQVYKSGQLEILDQSISRINEYQQQKLSSLSTTSSRRIHRSKELEKVLTSYQEHENVKINPDLTFRLSEHLIYCSPETLEFLNPMNDDEIKLTIYIFLLMNGWKTSNDHFNTFFNNCKKITSKSPPLLLVDPKKLEMSCSGLDIHDEVLGIREELSEIHQNMTSQYYRSIVSVLDRKEEEIEFPFTFNNFLFCYSIVERFSVRSFQYLYVVPFCRLFEAYNISGQARIHFRCFDRFSQSLQLYHPQTPKMDEIVIHQNDVVVSSCFIHQGDLTADEFFRKYGMVKVDPEKDTFPIDINFQSNSEDGRPKVSTIRTFLSSKRYPSHMKSILNAVYGRSIGEGTDMFGIMESFLVQVIQQIDLGEKESLDGDEMYTIFRDTKISILKENLKWIKNKEF